MDRTDPELRTDERTSLEQFLDYHRATLISRIEGLTKEQLSITLPPSELTLAGLIKHLALVEDTWFVERMAGRPLPEPWLSAPFDDDLDWDFHSAPDDTPERAAGPLPRCAAIAAGPWWPGTTTSAPSRWPSRVEGEGLLLAALDPDPHDRGDGPPQRPRRPAPRVDRRPHRRVTA